MENIRKELEETRIDFTENLYEEQLEKFECDIYDCKDLILTTPRYASGDYSKEGIFLITETMFGLYNIFVVDVHNNYIRLFEDCFEERVISFINDYFINYYHGGE